MKLLFVLAAMCLAGALPRVQSCCRPLQLSDTGDGNNARLAYNRDLHFDRPGTLTVAQSNAFQQCQEAFYQSTINNWEIRLDDEEFPRFKSGYPMFYPSTQPGGCNLFTCHCDHCYGPENCEGTNDGFKNDQKQRQQLEYKGRADFGSIYDCPALESFNVPGYTGDCVNPGVPTAGATTSPSPISAATRACADKDKVLNMTLPELTAVLSAAYCASPNSSVGVEFTSSLLATLDANKNGDVDCAEWGIAKQTTTLQQLSGGGYFGPKKLDPPLCKLSPVGMDTIARYNAYLGKLTLATLAQNTTAFVASAASRAALTVENDVVAGSAAGVVLAARDKIAAAWNATTTG